MLKCELVVPVSLLHNATKVTVVFPSLGPESVMVMSIVPVSSVQSTNPEPFTASSTVCGSTAIAPALRKETHTIA